MFRSSRTRGDLTEIVADAGSSSRGFSSAFARFQPQRELRIITAAYPVATGVKPQPPPSAYAARTGVRVSACGSLYVQGVSARTHLRTRTWRMYVCTYSKGWKLHAMLPMCSSLNPIRLDPTRLPRINATPENYHVNPKPRKSKARRTRTACIACAQNRFSLCAYLIYTLENALTAANRELSASVRYAMTAMASVKCKGQRANACNWMQGLHRVASL